MSAKERTGLDDSGTADLFVDQLSRSFTIGTDGEGYDHHYWLGADAVVVYKQGEREVDRVEYLDGALLKEWVAYIDGRRGWVSKGQLASVGVTADYERKTGQDGDL